MSVIRRRSGIDRALLAVLVVLFSLSLVSVAAAQDATPAASQAPATIAAEDAITAATGSDGLLRFDVAENGTQFIFDTNIVYDDGMPANGSTFVTRGYLYPAGTLTGTNGVLADGSPEFPDLVLGEWACRGWYIGEAAHATTGPWVITSQIYNFGGEIGAATLTSDGYELADIGVEVARSLTGGTGPFAGATGEQRQTFLGFNATMGANLQIEIEHSLASQ
jgi:hypothetical protein